MTTSWKRLFSDSEVGYNQGAVVQGDQPQHKHLNRLFLKGFTKTAELSPSAVFSFLWLHRVKPRSEMAGAERVMFLGR